MNLKYNIISYNISYNFKIKKKIFFFYPVPFGKVEVIFYILIINLLWIKNNFNILDTLY